jgi:hypothetical protein
MEFKTVVIIMYAITAIIAITEGIRDARHGTDPDHSKDFWTRVIMGMIICLLANTLYFWRAFEFLDTVLAIGVSSFLMLVSFGFMYGAILNISYNLTKNKPLGYIGNTAETDKIARKENLTKWLTLLFIGGAILFGVFYWAWVFGDHWN